MIRVKEIGKLDIEDLKDFPGIIPDDDKEEWELPQVLSKWDNISSKEDIIYHVTEDQRVYLEEQKKINAQKRYNEEKSKSIRSYNARAEKECSKLENVLDDILEENGLICIEELSDKNKEYMDNRLESNSSDLTIVFFWEKIICYQR